MQKFSKSGCAIFLVACPVLIAAVHRCLPPATGEERPWFAAAAGVLLATGLSSLWLLLTGRVASRDDLLERSQRAQPPADGETLLVTGPVRAARPLLTAPISGAPCVAYFYRMYRVILESKRMPEEVPVYWGYASRRLAVETPLRSVAVEAPLLSLVRTPYEGDEAVARAREYVRTVSAELRGPRPVFAGDPVLQWMGDISADEDGTARRDWKSGEEVDPAALKLEELVLPPDVEVSVLGRWSAEREAIVAGERPGDVRATVAVGPASALGLAAGAPPSLVASWIGTLVTLLAGLGLVWFAKEVWPGLGR